MTPQAQSSSQPLVQGLQQVAFRSGTIASGGMEPVQPLGWRAERHALGKNSPTRPLVVVCRSGGRLVFAGQPRLARAPARRLAGTRRSGAAVSDKRAPMRESSARAHSSATTHASSTCANHSRTGNDTCPAVAPAKSTSRVSPASRDSGSLLHAMLRQKAALHSWAGNDTCSAAASPKSASEMIPPTSRDSGSSLHAMFQEVAQHWVPEVKESWDQEAQAWAHAWCPTTGASLGAVSDAARPGPTRSATEPTHGARARSAGAEGDTSLQGAEPRVHDA
ncbi:hypothetical protein CYMTET_37241 [Cymbomonas tetramitiformis]|uniref:Uncharacterized protein n=1 Tax=Cymbomonas tetramitiformis TaxID=36881 RepID=A0AAE0CFX5_9CHLO|nr:hypothetical protein CYMTET_37241 [Cymbomonas tetramitiformis]